MARIEVHAVCWNEEAMLPFFLRHYRFADRVVVWDNHSTDRSPQLVRVSANAEVRTWGGDELDNMAMTRLKNDCWKGSAADWVVVCDVDEFVHRPGLEEFLVATPCAAFRCEGYDMVCDELPDPSSDLTAAVRTGCRNPLYDKVALFSPRRVGEVRYEVGCHAASPAGGSVCAGPEVKLLHYRWMGLGRVLARWRALNARRSRSDVANGFGRHYAWGEAEVAAAFEDARRRARDVV